jgi:hypothetical protein
MQTDTPPLPDLPTLSSFIRDERESVHKRLKKLQQRVKLYLQFLRLLRRRGVPVEFSYYGATEAEVNVVLF